MEEFLALQHRLEPLFNELMYAIRSIVGDAASRAFAILLSVHNFAQFPMNIIRRQTHIAFANSCIDVFPSGLIRPQDEVLAAVTGVGGRKYSICMP